MRLVIPLAALCVSAAAQPVADFKVQFPQGSLGYYSTAAAPGARPAARLVVLAPGFQRAAAAAELERWREAAGLRGWVVVAPYTQRAAGDISYDGAVQMLDAVLADARERLDTDPAGSYLVGRELTSPLAFYVASRAPDRIAAALAWGGTPREAIETNRLFGTNTANTPVLWLAEARDSEVTKTLRNKLLAVGFNFAVRSAQGFTMDAAFDWLAQSRLRPYQPAADCETGSLSFARCYWVEIAKFDPNQRNDALSATRVPPGTGASLADGGIGYRIADPGPGVLVERLPEKYRGPLRAGDRIVAFAGQPLPDAAAFVELMNRQAEEREVVLMIERGGRRQRVETRVVLPKREENFTARVRAEHFADTSDVLVITRGVAELRLDLPAHWIPADINWNGNVAGKADQAGCWLLSPGAPARPCGK